MFDCVWPTRTAVSGIPGNRWIALQTYRCCSGSGMQLPQKESLISSTLRSPKTSALLSQIAHAAAAGLEKKAVWVSQRHSFITLRPRRQWVHTCMSLDSLGRLSCFSWSCVTDCNIRLTMHNVHHLLSLMRSARNAILEDQYPAFVQRFFSRYFRDKGAPSWAVTALKGVGIDLTG
jgi:hypothetical protein